MSESAGGRTSEDSTTLYSRWGRSLAIIGWVLCAGAIVTLVWIGHYLGLLRYGALIALLAYGLWLMFWIPSVTIAPYAVIIRNLVRMHQISWPAIQLVDTKYALTITTPKGKVTAWSAPAPSRWSGLRTARAELKNLPGTTYGVGGSVRPGDIPRSESGLAALYVRRYWEQLSDQGLLNAGVEGSGVVTTWLRTELITLGVLVVLTVAGLALVRY